MLDVVLGLRDSDISNHPEEEVIHHFMGGQRLRISSKRLGHLNLRSATEKRGEGRGKSLSKCNRGVEGPG